ncbi:PREDICTED: F-box protein At2g38590-like [Camelina sativa]|uniref:F-box protein At2g38590-like n=1 Tax=Camelina sativa TaxID=90675 RepID=A0ABM0XRX8_CAMSA|nr:PREDICTED: F-box protein At2g38590-like [Camelina sativa]
MNRFSYALGYDDKKSQSCRSHKFLRFIDSYYQYDPEKQFFLGNTYWCAAKRNEDVEDVFADCIICFDFTSERFGPLLPLPCSGGYHDYTTLSCVREEKLALLLQHDESNPYELDLWFTTKIETEEVLWSKFLRVETAGFDSYVPHICGGFFIDEEKKLAIGFDEDNRHSVIVIGEANYLKALDLGGDFGHQYRPDMCSYVPSLVQIKQPAGGEGKQHSDLEKIRYYENMSRLVSRGPNLF